MKTNPLKDNWKVDEDAGFVQDQIKDRVNSEDNYTSAKRWPIIKSEDISGRAGVPKPGEVEYIFNRLMP